MPNPLHPPPTKEKQYIPPHAESKKKEASAEKKNHQLSKYLKQSDVQIVPTPNTGKKQSPFKHKSNPLGKQIDPYPI
jgi:hypothetical protein